MLAPILALGIPTSARRDRIHLLQGPPSTGLAPRSSWSTRRTATLAHQRIDTAIKDGGLARAHAGLTALTLWLKQEIRTGPKRHRIGYARTLEQAELRKEQVSEAMGLPTPAV